MCYADDIALVVIAKHLEDAELYSCEAISVKALLESAGLELVEEKTEAVLINKRRKRNYACIRIVNHIITSKPTIKYLEVIIDGQLNFMQYIEHTCEKAPITSMALARMMPNAGGPQAAHS